jgi:hypothetical protein
MIPQEIVFCMLGGPLTHATGFMGAISTPLCCNILKYTLCYSPYCSYRATSHAGVYLNAHSIAYFIRGLLGQGKHG